MSLFFRFLTLIAVAIGLAILARMNSGNVVFFYPPYRIDLSLNFFVVLSGTLFVLLYIIVSTFRSVLKMPSKVVTYRSRKREKESNKALRDALKALFEGRFGQAERAAQRALELPENAPLAALIASRAAQNLGQRARRDEWLKHLQNDPPYNLARLMTVIELLVEDHRPEEALDAVKELNQSGIRHIHALQWALKANQQTKNWHEVLRLVKTLDKRNALHPALSARLRELAYKDLLGDENHDAEALCRVWAGISSEDKNQSFVAYHAANAFNQRDMHEQAAQLVEKVLALEWDDRLVQAYRDAAGDEGSPLLLAQIEKCEQWIKQRPADAELALSLGALCLRQKLWGKAQRYLEQALSAAGSTDMVKEVHLKLAQMHEALQQPEAAAYHYRQCALADLL
jgi:HemY protein